MRNFAKLLSVSILGEFGLKGDIFAVCTTKSHAISNSGIWSGHYLTRDFNVKFQDALDYTSLRDFVYHPTLLLRAISSVAKEEVLNAPTLRKSRMATYSVIARLKAVQ